ncbi:MAG TPA: CinA family protein [Microlunatus sp.]|nr:CinA family protein [Microlunatus sp.]
MIFAADSAVGDLAATVVLALRNRSQTVATAESLTGGLVGATITTVPGASVVYRGGLITYATDLKAELAGVSAAVLASDGPVAPTTAAQLARGAARTCGADWGLATTGVAGPEPQDGHPVGQVFIAVAGPDPEDSSDGFAGERPVQVRELSLAGDRAEIRGRTVVAVLRLLIEQLEIPA